MFQKLVYVRNFPEAGMIRSLLVENGFHPPQVDASAHVTLAGADQVYYVELPEAEIPAARRFLTEAGFERVICSEEP